MPEQSEDENNVNGLMVRKEGRLVELDEATLNEGDFEIGEGATPVIAKSEITLEADRVHDDASKDYLYKLSRQELLRVWEEYPESLPPDLAEQAKEIKESFRRIYPVKAIAPQSLAQILLKRR